MFDPLHAGGNVARFSWLSLALIACGDSGGGAASGSAASSVTLASTTKAATSASASAKPDLPAPKFDCGDMTCTTFDTPEAAFAKVLEEKPLILSVGEAHAQKGDERFASSTKRFTDYLPSIKDKVAAVVVEVMVSPPNCAQEKVKKVETQQKEVTNTQADSNQTEYVALGKAALGLGLAGDALHPTCADLDKISKAGDGAIGEMLDVTTKQMVAVTKKFFEDAKKKSPEKMVVTYGGALHNDLVPRPGWDDWTFGKTFDTLSDHHYVELDIIVPEFVEDTKTWKGMPWYEAFKKGGAACVGDGARRTKTIVYSTGPHSYALIFPCTQTAK